MQARMSIAAVLVAATAAGCGSSSEPSAPKTAVDTAVSGLASRCGVALELRAYGRDGGPKVRRLDLQAESDARRLIGTQRAMPSATYLDQSMTQLLATEASDLRGCGLDRTAGLLARASS
jgi:hypothetical protein